MKMRKSCCSDSHLTDPCSRQVWHCMIRLSISAISSLLCTRATLPLPSALVSWNAMFNRNLSHCCPNKLTLQQNENGFIVVLNIKQCDTVLKDRADAPYTVYRILDIHFLHKCVTCFSHARKNISRRNERKNAGNAARTAKLISFARRIWSSSSIALFKIQKYSYHINIKKMEANVQEFQDLEGRRNSRFNI